MFLKLSLRCSGRFPPRQASRLLRLHPPSTGKLISLTTCLDTRHLTCPIAILHWADLKGWTHTLTLTSSFTLGESTCNSTCNVLQMTKHFRESNWIWSHGEIMAMTMMMPEEEEQVERKEVKAKREGKEEEEIGEDGPSFTCLTFALPGSQYPQGPRCSIWLLSFYRYRNWSPERWNHVPKTKRGLDVKAKIWNAHSFDYKLSSKWEKVNFREQERFDQEPTVLWSYPQYEE